jgi:hypothetical protein
MAKGILVVVAVIIFATLTAGCSGPITTREQGGLIGGGLGAGAGAIIGSTVGHAAVGALIGGPIGLLAGALIDDHLMGEARRQEEQAKQIDNNQSELERLKRENEQLRQQPSEI